MKKIFTAICIFTLMIFCTTCFAELPDEEFSAEKIYLDDELSDVKNLYGEPLEEHISYDKKIKRIFQTPKGKLLISFNDRDKVDGISIMEGTSETGSFIKINSTAQEVIEKYGEPTRVDKNASNNYTIMYRNPVKNYKIKTMIFNIKENKVTNIIIVNADNT